MSNVNYFLLGVVWVISIFAIAVGTEKMLKIVVWNYVLTTICLTLSSVIDSISTSLGYSPSTNYENLRSFIINGKTGIILVIYLILLVILLNKSKMSFDIHNMSIPRFPLTILLIIMSTISILFTLAIAIWGTSIMNVDQVGFIANFFNWYPVVYQIVNYIPGIIMVHGLLTLFIISDSVWNNLID